MTCVWRCSITLWHVYRDVLSFLPAAARGVPNTERKVYGSFSKVFESLSKFKYLSLSRQYLSLCLHYLNLSLQHLSLSLKYFSRSQRKYLSLSLQYLSLSPSLSVKRRLLFCITLVSSLSACAGCPLQWACGRASQPSRRAHRKSPL